MGGGKNGFKLHEQAILWIAALIAFGACVTHLPYGADDTFEVVPGFVLSASSALGIVLLSYGGWAMWRARAESVPSLGAAAFSLPFVGLAAWSAPFLAEALLR